jgi:hypothetical protein
MLETKTTVPVTATVAEKNPINNFVMSTFFILNT